MAVIPDPRFRAVDSEGNVYVGAVLRFRDAGTTNLSTVYSDPSLETELTNPTTGADKSNSDGYFPQVFGPEGATYDILCTDADGVTLWTLESVPAVGADSGDITRDFGSGGRFRGTGSAGEIKFQAGPPEGDDTGGAFVFEGHNGTQLDTFEINAAATSLGGSFDTGGALTENGKALTGVVQTGRTAFSGAAFIAVALPNSPSGVLAWDVEFYGIVVTATSALSLTVSVDNGSTYLATGYKGSVVTADSTSLAAVASATTKLDLAGSSVAVDSTHPARVRVTIRQPDTTAGRIRLVADAEGLSTTTAEFQGFASGSVAATARVTHLKLTASGGNFSGFYRVVPLRGF